MSTAPATIDTNDTVDIASPAIEAIDDLLREIGGATFVITDTVEAGLTRVLAENPECGRGGIEMLLAEVRADAFIDGSRRMTVADGRLLDRLLDIRLDLAC